MAQIANLTPEVQCALLAQLQATGASVTKDPLSTPTVPVPLIVADSSDSSGDMKLSQDMVQNDSPALEKAALTPEDKAAHEAKEALKVHAKDELKPFLKKLKTKFGTTAFLDKGCLKPKPGYELAPPEQALFVQAQARYDELAKLYKDKLDIVKALNKAERLRKAAEKKAAEKKAAEEQLFAKQSADDLDSPSEEDSEDDSEDRKHDTKRKADEPEEASDNEDVDMPGDSVQNLIGNLGAIIMGLEAGWKKATLIEHGFLKQLPKDKKRWSEAEQLDAEEMRNEVQEIMDEYVNTKEARDSLIDRTWTFCAGPAAKAAKLCYEIVQRKASFEDQADADADAEAAGHAEELAALNDIDKEKIGAHVLGKMKSGRKQGSPLKRKRTEAPGPSEPPKAVNVKQAKVDVLTLSSGDEK
jgi:hypothetical protein